MMDHHVRSQLVRGLDFSDGKLACPFKTCARLQWPNDDELLFHYASQHQVLDKVLMFETEKVMAELKQRDKTKEHVIKSLENDLVKSNATRVEVLALRDKEVKYLDTVIASKDDTIN